MDKIRFFVSVQKNNTTAVKAFILATLIVLSLLLASCSKTDVAEDQTAIKVNEFAQLLENGENEAVKNMLVLESDEAALVQYKALLLQHISEQTELYIKAYQSDAADLEMLEANLTQLRGMLEEVSVLTDALDYYDKMQHSEEYFALGLAYYYENEIQNAQNTLMLVDENNKNYESATEILSEIQQYDDFWESRVGSGLYGRKNTGVTEQDGCIYFPFTQSGMTMIIKHDANQNETAVFPIAETKGEYLINSINAAGDYLFFIAGENVGKGYVVENPYNIYRMKNDGTELTLMARGDYFDLICYEDVFYALSYKDGLVKFDRFLGEREIIKKEDIISVQPSPEGVYYVQREENEFLSEDTLYFYDGIYSKEVYSEQNLRCYFYDDEIVYTYFGYYDNERFIITDDMFETPRQYFCKDIREYFGKIDETVFALTSDLEANEYYLVYDLIERSRLDDVEINRLCEYEILGVCEEIGRVLLNENDGIYFSDVSLKERVKIDVPAPDENVLAQNAVRMISGGDWYTDEEYVYIASDYWHYSDSTLYVTVEKEYTKRYDSTIYITHIRTTGEDKLSLGYVKEPPGESKDFADSIAMKNHAVFAVNGDFWNEASNPWTGIIIREGEVYKDKLKRDMMALNEDGTISCYSSILNPITLEELQDKNVQNTMSFGPEILINGGYGNVDEHSLARANPRTSIGMIEPNHFVVICCDGRSFRSRGLTLRQLADMYSQLGCTEAYNLDGGQSMSIMFMGELLNDHSDDFGNKRLRRMSEILYIGQTELVQPESAKDNEDD